MYGKISTLYLYKMYKTSSRCGRCLNILKGEWNLWVDLSNLDIFVFITCRNIQPCHYK